MDLPKLDLSKKLSALLTEAHDEWRRLNPVKNICSRCKGSGEIHSTCTGSGFETCPKCQGTGEREIGQ